MRLLSWIKSLKPRNAYVAIFVPCLEKGEGDLVAAFWRFVPSRKPRELSVIRVNVMRTQLRDVLVENRLKDRPKRVLLFAHPTKDLNGFSVNSAPGNTGVLFSSWWEDEGKPYEILVAHVCWGAHVLRRRLWQKTFPRWVSYENEIRSFLASELGTTRWNWVLNQILQEVVKSNDPRSVQERLKAIYLRAMADLRDTYSARDGDIINLLYFQDCLESILSSED